MNLNKKRVFSFLAIFLAFVLTLTACGTTAATTAGTTSTTTAKANSSTSAQVTTDSTKTTVAGVKMGWLGVKPHPFWDAVKVGVLKWADANKNYNVTAKISTAGTTTIQQADLEGFAAQGIKYISVYPADASYLTSLSEEFKKLGITMVTYGTQPTWPSAIQFAVATDVKAAAKIATEYICEYLGGKGNIINVLDNLNDPNTVRRKEGVLETIKKYPNIVLIDEVSGFQGVEEATAKISDVIAAKAGKVDAIITTGGTGAVGLTNALAEYNTKSGTTKKIVGIGIDTDANVLKAINSGYMVATIAQNSEAMGYLSMEILSLFSQGWVKAKDAPNLINSGCVVVTKSNLETYSKDLKIIADEIAATLKTKYLTKP